MGDLISALLCFSTTPIPPPREATPAPVVTDVNQPIASTRPNAKYIAASPETLPPPFSDVQDQLQAQAYITLTSESYARRFIPPTNPIYNPICNPTSNPTSNPDLFWKTIKNSQTFLPATTVITPDATNAYPPKLPNMIRFVAISDTHGLHAKPISATHNLPHGDVLLHAGDFTNKGTLSDLAAFTAFIKAAETAFTNVVVIAGNHDVSLDAEYYARECSRWHKKPLPLTTPNSFAAGINSDKTTYLLDEGCIVAGGLQVYGSPWQPEFCEWAFNLNRGASCREKWDLIPASTDVLLTHGPPLGRGDECKPRGNRAGCADLLEVVQSRVKPKVHVFGHIHEGFGTSSDGVTDFVNASTCTWHYKPTNSPVVFDIPALV